MDWVVGCAHMRCKMSEVIQQFRRGDRRRGTGFRVNMWRRDRASQRVMLARLRQESVEE
jgi:hypothetical protein